MVRQVRWDGDTDGVRQAERQEVRWRDRFQFTDLCSTCDIRRLTVLPGQHTDHLERQTGRDRQVSGPVDLCVFPC